MTKKEGPISGELRPLERRPYYSLRESEYIPSVEASVNCFGYLSISGRNNTGRIRLNTDPRKAIVIGKCHLPITTIHDKNNNT